MSRLQQECESVEVLMEAQHRVVICADAEDVALSKAKESGDGPLIVRVCAGTSCFLRNSQEIIQGLMKHVEANDLGDRVQVQATFCFELCEVGPNVAIGETIISQATLEKVVHAIHAELKQ